MRLAAWAAAALLFAAPVFASGPEPAGWSVGSGVDAVSRYVWRGIPLSEGPALQPEVAVERGGWSASAWSNFVANNEPSRGRFNETELDLARVFEAHCLRVFPQLSFYSYPHRTDIKDTLEAAVELTYPVGPLFLTTDQAIDALKYHGAYYGAAGFGCRRTWAGWESVGLLSAGWASAEFNEAYLGLRQAGWNALGAELSATKNVGRFSVKPHLEWSRLLDGDVRRAAGGGTIFRGGMAVGISF